MKRSQTTDVAIALLHCVPCPTGSPKEYAMTNYVFTHLGCSQKKGNRTPLKQINIAAKRRDFIEAKEDKTDEQ